MSNRPKQILVVVCRLCGKHGKGVTFRNLVVLDGKVCETCVRKHGGIVALQDQLAARLITGGRA